MCESPDEKAAAGPETTEASDRLDSDARRAALAQMGRYAAYTAPALLALLISTKAHAIS